MAARGTKPGNQNARGNLKPRIWQDAIRRALARREKGKPDRLNRLADALLDKCEEKDISALKEFGDRIEGKSVQPTEISGSIQIEKIERVVVNGSK